MYYRFSRKNYSPTYVFHIYGNVPLPNSQGLIIWGRHKSSVFIAKCYSINSAWNKRQKWFIILYAAILRSPGYKQNFLSGTRNPITYPYACRILVLSHYFSYPMLLFSYLMYQPQTNAACHHLGWILHNNQSN